MRLRNLGLALAGTVALGLATAAPASAQHHWHHGGWGGGFAPGFVGGLAVGAAVGAPYYGYGYGYGPYAYAGDCYIRRHVVINRFGERVVRRVRVCD